jgi:glycosyltransferase involved in cell wall biosynthesis
MAKSVAIICPDQNIKLWPRRIEEAAMGGGKSAILQLARAWGRRGYRITIAGAFVEEAEYQRVRTIPIEDAKGQYDVLVFVTGSLGHFRIPGIEGIKGQRSLFWMNSPLKMQPPETHSIDYYIAPAQFIARRAVDEWGYPSRKVVVIRGEAVVRRRRRSIFDSRRSSYGFVYASHPFKGLDNAIAALDGFKDSYPDILLDVYGGAVLHGDDLIEEVTPNYPKWVRTRGSIPQAEIEKQMSQYGGMLYLTHYVDGFSLATSEALAAGVLVIATAHGSNAELIRHGWNGFLVGVRDGQPDLGEAKEILSDYFANPSSFESIRRNAVASMLTWSEQAAQWEKVWLTNNSLRN